MSLIKILKSLTVDHILIVKPAFGVLYFEALVVFVSYEVIAAVCSFIGVLNGV